MNGENFQLVGKRHSEYIKDGVQKSFDSLFFVSAAGADPEVEGSSVREVNCPKTVLPSTLEIGRWYEFQYQLRRTSRGMMAFLQGFKVVEV